MGIKNSKTITRVILSVCVFVAIAISPQIQVNLISHQHNLAIASALSPTQQTVTTIVRDTTVVARKLQINKYQLISPGVVSISGQTLGSKNGFLVRDTDGHTMRIMEK